jgi:hypothetical protein
LLRVLAIAELRPPGLVQDGVVARRVSVLQ